MWEEVYPQKMTEDWSEVLRCQDSTLRNMERIKDLRTLMKAAQEKLNEHVKGPTADEAVILHEKVILEAVRKEIRRLEGKILYSEFGIE